MSFLSKSQKQQISSALQLQNVTKRQQKTPRRSRSVSRSRSRSKPRTLSTVAQKRNRRENKNHVMLAKKAITELRPIIQQHLEAKKRLEGAKLGYFKDTKDLKSDPISLQKDVDQLQREIDMAKTALKAGLGNRPIRLRLTAEVTITTIVTTGVTTTVVIGGNTNQISPSDSTEYGSVAALFDEFKCMGGHVDFLYKNPNTFDLTTAADLKTNSMPVIAYDTDNGTALTSTEQGCQLAQHELLNPVMVATSGGGAAFVNALVPAEGTRHHFKFRVPTGTMIGGSVITIGDQWQTTAGTPSPVGFLKFYHVGSSITATVAGRGIFYYDAEFRCKA